MGDQPLDLTCPPRYWADSINKSPAPVAEEPADYSKHISVNIPNATSTPIARASAAGSIVNGGGDGVVRRYSNCSDNFSLTSDRSPSLSPSSAVSDGLITTPQNSGGRINDVSRLKRAAIKTGDIISDGGSSSHSDYESGVEGSETAVSPSPPTSDGGDFGGKTLNGGVMASGPATKRFLSKYIEERKGKTLSNIYPRIKVLYYSKFTVCYKK